MTKQEIIKKLKEASRIKDIEDAHGAADDALIEFIDDPEITAAYHDVKKWYS